MIAKLQPGGEKRALARSSKGALGLYIHIPFCRALCHYCDFAKTAHYDRSLMIAYRDALVTHLDAWQAILDARCGQAHEPGLDQAVPSRAAQGPTRWRSLFLGGGTPSLWREEWQPLFERIVPRLLPDAEVTLEANPDDIDAASLALWRQLGINRLSLGIQTFDDAGLRFMKRTHDGEHAWAALRMAREVFSDVNADLIYGWPGQTRQGFASDLARLIESGVTHLSLYTLTYEPRTPIGRAALRGRLPTPADEDLAAFYEDATQTLARCGYVQEEVSNWHLAGYPARHNGLYWDDSPFVGLGAGAHGYLAGDGEAIGWRYSYPRSERSFARVNLAAAELSSMAPAQLAEALGAELDESRDGEAWLTEYVGAGLRTARGIDLERIRTISGHQLRPNAVVADALATGLLTLQDAQSLRLAPQEWFRETAWCVAVLQSLHLPHQGR